MSNHTSDAKGRITTRTTLPLERVPGYPGEWRRASSRVSKYHAVVAMGKTICGTRIEKNRSVKENGDAAFFGVCERCARALERETA